MNEVAWRWRWPALNVELHVARSVVEVLTTYRQRMWQTERGGQLFVNPEEPRGLLLAMATHPHPADRAGWSWLELDADRCRVEIEEANTTGLRLVGYWHTHPQVSPKISTADIASFTALENRNSGGLRSPLAVIVGNPTHHAGIRAWSFQDGRVLEAELLEA